MSTFMKHVLNALAGAAVVVGTAFLGNWALAFAFHLPRLTCGYS